VLEGCNNRESETGHLLAQLRDQIDDDDDDDDTKNTTISCWVTVQNMGFVIECNGKEL
jgi:hypothetical protein